MIRREVSNPNGDPYWLLIPQTEHARVAAELARHWSVFPPFFNRLVGAEQTIAAILHHEDGWAESDSELQFDAQAGRPCDFTETSLDCWIGVCDRSVNACAGAGAIAGALTCCYFQSTIQWFFDRNWPSDDAAKAFNLMMHAKYDGYFRDWSSENPSTNTEHRARKALRQIATFTTLGFILFCYEPRDWLEQLQSRPQHRLGDFICQSCQCREANAVEFGDSVNNRRLSMRAESPKCLRIDPWPLDVPELRISVAANAIPIRKYSSQAAMRAALGPHTTLTFQLLPST